MPQCATVCILQCALKQMYYIRLCPHRREARGPDDMTITETMGTRGRVGSIMLLICAGILLLHRWKIYVEYVHQNQAKVNNIFNYFDVQTIYLSIFEYLSIANTQHAWTIQTLARCNAYMINAWNHCKKCAGDLHDKKSMDMTGRTEIVMALFSIG